MTETQKNVVLHVADVHKHFGGLHALSDIDLQNLQNAFADQPALGAFWQSLKPGYDYFEQNRRMPAVTVDARGTYRVNGAAVTPAAAPAGLLGKPLPGKAIGAAGNNEHDTPRGGSPAP